ncbi:MAG: RNA methyltransferase [Actinomycetota bacterium]|nr:RNA methyltransferase [Actinomycetota bacterium]
MIEGVFLIMEALDSKAKVLEIVYDESLAEEAMEIHRWTPQTAIHGVSRGIMEWVCGVAAPPGIIGIVEQVDLPLDSLLKEDVPQSLVVVASGVRDPASLGLLIRVADAFGADGLISTSESVDLYNPKTVRAAAGSHFHVSLVREANFNLVAKVLQERGMKRFALDGSGDKDIFDVDLRIPLALIVSDEARGISDELLRLVDEKVKVPFPGRVKSLNVGVSTGIALFEILRARGILGAQNV